MTSSPEESSTPKSPEDQEGPEDTEKSAVSADSLVLHATDNQVSWITLNRPESLNAITPDQRERLIQLFSEASADPAVRAVVLTGNGPGFLHGRGSARRPGAGRPGSGSPVTWPASSAWAPSA